MSVRVQLADNEDTTVFLCARLCGWNFFSFDILCNQLLFAYYLWRSALKYLLRSSAMCSSSHSSSVAHRRTSGGDDNMRVNVSVDENKNIWLKKRSFNAKEGSELINKHTHSVSESKKHTKTRVCVIKKTTFVVDAW
jgi:hypothetical protein